MASNRSPRGKVVRRLGTNIFGNRKYDKIKDRKPQGPGKAPKVRVKKVSDYAVQLLEKQRYRIAYGLGERQMRTLFHKARRAPGSTGEAMLSRLESRLSNVVYRMGWTASRPQARQLASHGHVLVNGKRVNIPSILLKPGDRIELKASKAVEEAARSWMTVSGKPPSWLERDEEGLAGRIVTGPTASEASVPGKIHLVVEYYTR
jgi:small subunit ribosomal protein S4